MASSDITTSTTKLTVAIGRMSEHDLLEVVEIEELSGLSRWGWEAYNLELQRKDEVIMLVARASMPGKLVRVAANSILGFIIARLIADEVHVNNVAVRPESRRLGVGSTLLDEVLSWGRRCGAMRALLEVRAGNLAAQALYQRCGFERGGLRRRYYRDPVEDALLMSVSLQPGP